MKEKTRRILGKICLGYSGCLLLLNVLVIVVPTMARISGRTWMHDLRSLGVACLIGGLGLYLVQGKADTKLIVRLIVGALLLTPLIVLEAASEIGPLHLHTEWLPRLRVFLVGLSIPLVCVPYALGGRILRRLETKRPKLRIAPVQSLQLIGMACSLMPSTIGFYLIYLGSSKDTIYYLVAISYVAAVLWWIWWDRQYSKAAQLNGGR